MAKEQQVVLTSRDTAQATSWTMAREQAEGPTCYSAGLDPVKHRESLDA